MKTLLLGAAMVLALGAPAFAQQAKNAREISAPIVAFTPVIAKNADALELTEAQRADLKQWLDTMPAKRKAIEEATLTARAELRAAIVAGAPVDERQALAVKVGEMETKLVMARSNCTDHWRATLTEAQFAKMLELAAM
ncbi:Spy/CpxP family protein refolding chaperone [Lentibacter sp. XHP0401]|jgi:Spy/CpxP family protein refolding chaperone|uniref:Spy/CpxP family protein refolding chaperone n=1 Tax=Lentibacter sp. XHP0401 TaxID=2984334 RepID=UPI0021E6E199|nr:Spy/CpxP family protein refolding chaperone [Lentibacter sp. XHP0401]MCV2893659.1 Spy/CpxP family protein refolding chaperone [Lentibacter sp. XHP0401]